MSNNDFIIENSVLSKYVGDDSEITIPEGVTHLTSNAFRCSKNQITSLILSEGLMEFKHCFISNNYAFANVEKIRFPGTIKTIGDFLINRELKSLNEIILPENIEGFEGSALEVIWDAFSKSDKKFVCILAFLKQYPELVLQNAVLNKSVKANKKKIVDLAIANDNVVLMKNLFSLFKNILIDDLDDYISKSEKSVDLVAFLLEYKQKNYSSDEIEKQESVKIEKELGSKKKTIADWKRLFKFKKEGNEIVIQKYIGDDIYVEVPDTIGNSKVAEVDNGAFRDCEKVVSVSLPDDLPRMGTWIFAGCINLTTVNIPRSITMLPQHTFSNCISLTSITLHSGVNFVLDSAFEGCRNLESVIFENNEKVSVVGKSFFGCEKLADKSGLIIVKNTLFGSVSKSITELIIPNGITRIGSEAFKDCSNLKSVVIPESVNVVGESAFENCVNLMSIKIPDSATFIGSKAFKNCINIESVSVPNSDISIYGGAFMGCEKIAKESGFIIVNNILFGTTLKDDENIVIPDNVIKIGERAFAGCINLKTVTIPDSVNEIDAFAFRGFYIMPLIKCSEDSYARTYAKENGIKYEIV